MSDDPKKGDYVLATKWSDGCPGDHWCVGFYDRCDRDVNAAFRLNPRHYVVNEKGQQFRHNGFRRVKKISHERGAFILAHADQIEASGINGRSLWWWARCSMRKAA